MRKLRSTLLCALVVSALYSPSRAGAAGYEVFACRLPNGAPAPAFGWITTIQSIFGANASLKCPGGVMTLVPRTKTHEPGAFYGFEFTAPPGTAIAGLDRHVEGNVGFINQGPPPYEWEAAEFGTKVGGEIQNGMIRLICGNCGVFTDDWAYRLDVLYSQIVLGLQCRPDRDACPSNGVHLEVRRVSVTLEDRRAPQILSSAGSLLAPSPRGGFQGLALKLRDVGGGLFKSRVEVDGARFSEAIVDDNLGRCKQPFVVPVPCKLSATLDVPFDTTKLTDGMHDVTVRVFDATGVNAAVFGPIHVDIDNVPDVAAHDATRIVCPPTSGGLLRRASRTLVPFGGPLVMTGRATRAKSVPRGARVVVIDETGRRLARASVPLRRHGRFRLQVRPRTPGVVRAALLSRSGAALRCASPLRVRVRAGLTFAVSPRRLHNGDSLSMRGRLRGLAVPPGGKSVAIQARARRGPAWTTVTVLRSDASGAFQFRYRFRRTFERTSYEFRAVAPGQRGYPYSRGWSRTRRALVMP